MHNNNILIIDNLEKNFPGVRALNNVSIEFRKGGVHALLGENGAGKSTLIKIISGVIKPDKGSMVFKGLEYTPSSPLEAQLKGISVVHQELNLAENLNVFENIFLGRPILKRILGKKFIDYQEMIYQSQNLLNDLGISIDLKAEVSTLSVAQKQIIEIAKALSYKSDLIIFDEPSATLTDKELIILFKIIKELKLRGVTILYISHRLEEIFSLADRVTVLRDGNKISTKDISSINKEELIKLMVGREISNQYPNRNVKISSKENILIVSNISNDRLKKISFELKKGEILGISGLVGAGRTELARAIYGVDKIKEGSIRISGCDTNIKGIKDAVTKGIALVPEERKLQGLVLGMTVKENITLASMNQMLKGIFVDNKKEVREGLNLIRKLNIITPSIHQIVKNLSGGNQQKVVLAKWIIKEVDILILDEPTRGIDVGAKQEIYKLMNYMVEKGKAIIMISSELPEIVGMCDRVLVMHNGQIKGELSENDISQEKIMQLAII